MERLEQRDLPARHALGARVTVSNYVGTRDELLRRANELFDWIRTGALEVRLERTYPLADAARAHEDLMSRTRTGKLVLDVAS